MCFCDDLRGCFVLEAVDAVLTGSSRFAFASCPAIPCWLLASVSRKLRCNLCGNVLGIAYAVGSCFVASVCCRVARRERVLCLETVQMKSCRDFRRFVLSGMFGFCEKMFARDFLETSVFSSVGKLSKTRKLKREVKRQ